MRFKPPLERNEVSVLPCDSRLALWHSNEMLLFTQSEFVWEWGASG